MRQPLLLKNEILTVKRNEVLGKYGDDGFPEKPRFKKFNIKGNAQPISGRERLLVEEGDRDRDIMDLWTSTEIRKDDIVVRKGIEYEVRTVEDWSQQNLAHFQCRIVRIDAEHQQ